MNHLEALYQNTTEIASICEQHKVKYVVLSPGSRSAPLALAFMRNSNIKHFIINDERSAGYVALGLAEQSKSPVALVCTSGTAALNYGPALAEAYYKRVPLIAFTTDRAESAQGKFENQTIKQKNLFTNNIASSLNIEIPNVDGIKIYKEVDEIIKTAKIESRPVQVNVQISEPLYSKDFNIDPEFKIEIPQKRTDYFIPEALVNALKKSGNIALVVGQHKYSCELNEQISKLAEKNITIFGDITSNMHEVESKINFPEVILKQNSKLNLKFDSIITFGRHILSKHLKGFLKNQPNQHWHIDKYGEAPEIFDAECKNIKSPPLNVLFSINQSLSVKESAFISQWRQLDKDAKELLDSKKAKDKEFGFIYQVLSNIPENSHVHLGNSLTVRLADMVNPSVFSKNIEFHSNRGTSGIDGCMSTAVGAALANPHQQHFLIIGDNSFVYDQNALWNKYKPNSLVIFVLNNNGGKIFQRIEGPPLQKEFEDYFVSKVDYSFEKAAEQYGLNFYSISNPEEIEQVFDLMKLDQSYLVEMKA